MQPRSLLFALVFAALLSPRAGAAGTEAKPASPADAGAALDRSIADHMREGGIAGIGAAIVVDGKVAWTRGYGFADRRRGVPFTPDTVLNIGSISKTVTGVAMMRAVEEGALSLDADINTYLPFRVVNPHRPEARITLRDLATHTSGITDRWAAYEQTYHYYGDTPEPLGEFLREYFVPGGRHYAADNFLDAAPGAQWEYSNLGAALAGYVVERAVGQSLPDYARARIFAPLGMASTAWRLGDVDPARHAALYVRDNGLTVPILLYEGTTYPEGGVRTSVSDLARLFLALLDGGAYGPTRILQPASVAEMERYQFSAAHKPGNLDLAEENAGLFWETKFNGTRVGHGGSDPGIKTEMLASPAGDIGVILFSNTSLPDEDMRHYAAIFLALWKHADGLKQAGATASR